MKKSNYFLTVLMTALALVAAGCKVESDDDTVAVTKVEISGESSVSVDGTITLHATITPANATNKTVTWKVTEGDTYASVGEKTGEVTGITKGSAKITATAGGVTSEAFEVSVVIPVTKVTLTVSAKDVFVDGTVTLSSTVEPAEAEGQVTYSITSGSDYATLTSNTLTATKSGAVKIKASAGGVDSEEVTVSVIPSDFISVQKVSVSGNETWDPESCVFISNRELEIPAFYMCKHEVTRDEYKAVMGENNCPTFKYIVGTEGKAPVNGVNWYQAIAYCNKLSIQEGLTPCYIVEGISDWEALAYSSIPTAVNSTWDAVTCDWTANGYRLPAETEWEWAARGGENYDYPGSDTIGDVAWYSGNSPTGYSGGNYKCIHEVMTKQANAYGFYDMSGNVSEWCWDFYAINLASAGWTGPETSSDERICRGGNYDTSATGVADTNHYVPNFASDGLTGFRVVRSAQ